jgi:hypothetical protein
VIPVPLRIWLVAGGRDGGRSARPSIGLWRGGLSAKLAVRGDLVAAEATAGGAQPLEVADVIYRRDIPACSRPLTWIAGTLDSYPGCEVAAISWERGGCLAGSRVTGPLSFSFHMPDDGGFDALACAMFLYGWLAAGWPSAALDRSQLAASAVLRIRGREVTARAAVLIPFGLFYEGPAPAPASSAGPSWPSRCRMPSASGASISE